MRTRADSVLASCVLYTIALLNLIPAALWYFYAGSDKVVLARLDAGFQGEVQMAHNFGVACLAIILIGLIVIWTGYVRRARSAWLVMFVVAWAWVFPLFVLPQLTGPRVFTLAEWIYNAIYESGHPRTSAQLVLIFALMVIALLLPIKSFFLLRETSTPIQAPSLKRIGRSAVIVLVVAIALFVWIHVQVYELTSEQLNSWQAPPPPPRPNCSEAQ